MMEKLEQDLAYKMKLFYILLTVVLLFNACADKEDKKVKKTVTKMVSVAKKIIDTNTTLSEIIQNDGIVVDGGRDEELLDAFGLAVSQAIVEDGVSVPDCNALEKTGYLTKDECEEVTSKYFGFYDIDKDGKAKKVDDSFNTGVAGDQIRLKESDIKYFDSSGNPLLENQVEFDEIVANSDDVDFLNGLASSVPDDKEEMKSNISKKIAFLQDVEDNNIKQAVNKATTINNKIQQEDQDDQNTASTNDNGLSDDELNALKSKYNAAVRNLDLLKVNHRKTKIQLDSYPESQSLINQYNEEEIKINELEQEVASYASQL